MFKVTGIIFSLLIPALAFAESQNRDSTRGISKFAEELSRAKSHEERKQIAKKYQALSNQKLKQLKIDHPESFVERVKPKIDPSKSTIVKTVIHNGVKTRTVIENGVVVSESKIEEP